MPTHGSVMAAGRFSVADSQCCFKERSNECKSRPRVWPEANKCVNECVKQHNYINMALPVMSNWAGFDAIFMLLKGNFGRIHPIKVA